MKWLTCLATCTIIVDIGSLISYQRMGIIPIIFENWLRNAKHCEFDYYIRFVEVTLTVTDCKVLLCL